MRFRRRFGDRVQGMRGWEDVDPFLEKYGIKYLYQIKVNNDGRVSKVQGVHTMVHAVFEAYDPYGDGARRPHKCTFACVGELYV